MENLFPSIVSIDENGIPRNIPNVHYKRWKINSLGFRGKEIDPEKKKGQIRIVCFGASETLGLFESEGKEWPSQLGEMLKDQYPEVEVINAAIWGLRQHMRKAYIEKYVLPLKPDIIVMNHYRLLTHIKDSIKGVEEKIILRPSIPKTAHQSKIHISANKLLSDFRNNILYKYLPKRLMSYYRMSKERQMMRRQRKLLREQEQKCLNNRRPLDVVPEHIIIQYEKDLSSFVEYLKERNIVPVMTTFPTLTSFSNKDIYEMILINNRLTFIVEISENGILDAMDKLRNVIKRTAEKQNVACVDINSLIPKTSEYFFDNFHYTDKGAGLFAGSIHKTLIQSDFCGKLHGRQEADRICVPVKGFRPQDSPNEAKMPCF